MKVIAVKLLCIVGLALSVLGFAQVHPFYVSVCQVDHNTQTRALEISMKIFTNDLEATLKAKTGKVLNLGTDKEISDADDLLGVYLNEHFSVKINGVLSRYKFLGKETDMDVTWCYMEVVEVNSVNSIEVTNDILTEQFETQTNLINIQVGKVRKSLLLNIDRKSGKADFL